MNSIIDQHRDNRDFMSEQLLINIVRINCEKEFIKSWLSYMNSVKISIIESKTENYDKRNSEDGQDQDND